MSVNDKRQEEEEQHNTLDDLLKHHDTDSDDSLLESCGKCFIIVDSSRATTTTRIDRGTFGDISLVLCETIKKNDDSNDNNNIMRLGVCKTILNAKSIPFDNNYSFHSNQQQQQELKLLPHVKNEIMALQLLQGGDYNKTIVDFWGLVVASDNQNHNHMDTSISLYFDYYPMDLQMLLSSSSHHHQSHETLLLLLPWNIIEFFAQDIWTAIDICHQHGFVHGDIKPGNFLISQRDGHLKLCDFGLARPITKQEPTTTTSKDKTNDNLESNENNIGAWNTTRRNNDNVAGLCTLWYRPPELLVSGATTMTTILPSIDVWSASLVMIEMISGRPLLTGKSVLDQLHLIVNTLGGLDNNNNNNINESESIWSDIPFRPTRQSDALPQSLTQIIPRIAECSHQQVLLERGLSISPSCRPCAREMLQTLSNQNNDDDDSMRRRRQVVSSWIPTRLKGFIFSQSSRQAACAQMVALAATRRDFQPKQKKPVFVAT